MKKMKNFLLSIFLLFCKKLIKGGLYAVHAGDKVGGFFVCIAEENRGESTAVLFMPNPMEALYVNNVEIELDLKQNNLKFVEMLPHDVYEVCRANFVYHAKKQGIYANRQFDN